MVLKQEQPLVTQAVGGDIAIGAALAPVKQDILGAPTHAFLLPLAVPATVRRGNALLPMPTAHAAVNLKIAGRRLQADWFQCANVLPTAPWDIDG